MKDLLIAVLLKLFGQTPIRRIVTPDGAVIEFLGRGVFPSGSIEYRAGRIVLTRDLTSSARTHLKFPPNNKSGFDYAGSSE